MTDAEIVARAIRSTMYQTTTQTGVGECVHPDESKDEQSWVSVDQATATVVAALTEAGRLLPAGRVCIDAGRWGRVRKAAWGWAEWVRLCDLNDAATEDAVIAESLTAALQPGDLDAEPAP